jgi:hypothetical protein
MNKSVVLYPEAKKELKWQKGKCSLQIIAGSLSNLQ